MTDELADIVLRVQAGDENAFAQLYLFYRRIVLAHFFRAGIHLADAEDLCQDVFLRAKQKLYQLREPRAFSEWLERLTRSALANWLAKRKRRREFPLLTDLSASDSSPVQLFELSEKHEQVGKALALLRPFDRNTLQAFYWEYMSIAQMAEAFSVPQGTIKRRLHEARKRFKKKAEEVGLTSAVG